MNYKIAIIALLVLAIIGFASAYLITFNHSQTTAKSTDTDKEIADDATLSSASQAQESDSIIEFIPMWNKASNETANFEVVWGNKNKAPESDQVIWMIPWFNKSEQKLPALMIINWNMTR